MTDLIDNRFSCVRVLGSGAFGIVHLATDKDNGDAMVVVKVIHSLDTKTRDWVLRKFKDEATALERLNRLNNPSIVKFVATGMSGNGEPYLAMEYIDGHTLDNDIDPNTGLASGWDGVAHIIQTLGDAISAAHGLGIYHRDLKPTNIMICPGAQDYPPQVKIIDFGIATVKARLEEKTQATALAGTLYYMAPEQLKGKPSAASDIFALGVIAYEMLTGRRPFTPRGDNFISKATHLHELHLNRNFTKPRELVPELSVKAQDDILKALAYEPKDRFPSASDFGRSLAQALTTSAVASTLLDGPPTRWLSLPPTGRAIGTAAAIVGISLVAAWSLWPLGTASVPPVYNTNTGPIPLPPPPAPTFTPLDARLVKGNGRNVGTKYRVHCDGVTYGDNGKRTVTLRFTERTDETVGISRTLEQSYRNTDSNNRTVDMDRAIHGTSVHIGDDCMRIVVGDMTTSEPQAVHLWIDECPVQ